MTIVQGPETHAADTENLEQTAVVVAPRPASAEPAGDCESGSSPSVATTRVLHVINGEHYSGAERVQDLLAGCLPEFGYEVGFACVKADRFPELRQSKEPACWVVPMRGRFDLRAAWRVARLVRRNGYALVHAHTPRSAMVGRLAAAMAGVPFVYHVHSPTARDSTRRWRNKFNAWTERLSTARAARLIAVSQSLGNFMRGQGYPADQIAVAPNGVPGGSPALRQPPAGVWTLGTVALFRPRKGLEVLIDALAILREQSIAVRLRAVGGFETPEYEREILDRVERLDLRDAIDWTGFTRNVPAELARMDLMALPSLFGEGLPMVVLEAMAAGVPVVATSVEGVPEAIRDRTDGVLVEPGDAVDLARGIAEIVRGDLDWTALRESALARHRTTFSDRAMAAGVAEVYRAILA